ncbi:MAG: hypothetical protein AAF292_11610 [Pseudomonadota bacterium]
MELDHIVIRTPNRSALLTDLTHRFGLAALRGFTLNGVTYSEGVRFSNSQFIDVFDHPSEKPKFEPLLAFKGDIAHIETIAAKHGWSARTHFRTEFPKESRPPWSTLSFRRGQGLISSIFFIEYEENLSAWTAGPYNGDLYDRHLSPDIATELKAAKYYTVDLSKAQAQLRALSEEPVPLLELHSAEGSDPGLKSILIQKQGVAASEWSHAAFDSA